MQISPLVLAFNNHHPLEAKKKPRVRESHPPGPDIDRIHLHNFRDPNRIGFCSILFRCREKADSRGRKQLAHTGIGESFRLAAVFRRTEINNDQKKNGSMSAEKKAVPMSLHESKFAKLHNPVKSFAKFARDLHIPFFVIGPGRLRLSFQSNCTHCAVNHVLFFPTHAASFCIPPRD